MNTSLRLAALLTAALCGVAAAQSTERPKPPGTKPLEEPPPPPALPAVAPGQADIEAKPDVTVRKEGPNTIEEYRLHGKLYMMKVTPAHGHPYVLMDLHGDGTFTRNESNSLDQGIRVPQWVLWEF